MTTSLRSLMLMLSLGLAQPAAAWTGWLHPKPLPKAEATFEELFGPNTTYPYFAAASRLPFRQDAKGYDLVNAWWLAECSMLVYSDPGVSRRALQQAKLPGFKAFDRNGTQCFVAFNDRFAVVTFRGTEVSELQDVITDLKFLPTASGHGGLVHRGFKEALDLVWPDVAAFLEARLKTRQKVFFTGHSLGAALATLAAGRYGKPCGLYTFGSPRVGSSKFGSSLKATNYRFVHQNDGVTKVPPLGEHTGHLKYIDGQGQIHSSASLPLVLGDRTRGYADNAKRLWKLDAGKTLNAVKLDNLRDHAPIFYVTAIWNALVDAPIEGSYRLRSKAGDRISVEINRIGLNRFSVVRRVSGSLPRRGKGTLFRVEGQRPKLIVRYEAARAATGIGAGGRLEAALSGGVKQAAASQNAPPLQSVYRFYLDGRIAGKTRALTKEATATRERGSRHGKPRNPSR